MNSKPTTSAVSISALLLPVAAHPEDSGTDRSSPKAFANGSLITTRIKARMAKDKDLSALHIKVDTDKKCILTLSGKAKNQEESDKAIAIARGVKGVVSVENNIQIVAQR